jgi:hypothetical protein
MNREDIIRMAKEVELINKDYDLGFLNKFTDKVERFAALVASAEREACAKMCDSYYESWINIHGRYEFMGEGAQECATAIRARGRDAA